MSKLNSKKSRILGFAVLSAFVVLLSACGNKNQILPPVVPPTTTTNTNTGGGFVGGACGGVGGTPIGNSQYGNQPFTANLQPLNSYNSGSTVPSMVLYLGYGQNPGSLLGSVTLNVNVNALLGNATSPYQQPVCASTTGQQGQVYGSGYAYGNQYFVVQQMAMSGYANVQYYNQTVQAPIQVYLLGQNCQSYGGYVDLYSRKFMGCVAMVLGGQQAYYFQAY
ncbi:MAG: hypothetical protein KDD51_07735 [Bdellovibrionales bacterium]|nr:hypothetical protein [Bdellovibrionales bacterium]